MDKLVNDLERQRFLNEYNVKDGGLYTEISEDDLLKEHLRIDLTWFVSSSLREFLNEGKLIKGSKQLLIDFGKYFYNEIDTELENKNTVDREWIYHPNSFFVPEIHFQFKINYQPRKEKDNGIFSYYERKSVNYVPNKTFRDVDYKSITISCEVNGNNIDAIYESLKSFIYHEIIHAYEDYQRLMKGEENGLYGFLEKQGYLAFSKNNATEAMDIEALKDKLKRFVYSTNTTERNAYIGQINADVFNDKDFDNIVKDVKNTESYRRMEYIKNTYNEFLKCKTPVLKKEKITPQVQSLLDYITRIQNILIDYYNVLRPNEKPVSKYSEMLHDMSIRKGCFERHYIRKIGQLTNDGLLKEILKMYCGTFPEPSDEKYYLLEEKDNYQFVVEL